MAFPEPRTGVKRDLNLTVIFAIVEPLAPALPPDPEEGSELRK